MRAWLGIMLVVACSSEPRKLPEPLAALENAYNRTPAYDRIFELDDVILAPTGLFVRGGRRATYIDLVFRAERALAAAPQRDEHSLIVMPGAPAAALVIVLDAAARLGWRKIHIGAHANDSITSVCHLRIPPRDPRNFYILVDDEHVDLSLYITSTRIWIGISRVNEFVEIPRTASGIDLMRLDEYLREQRGSAFFVDRDDIELGWDPGISTTSLLAVMQIACLHFHSIKLVALDELSARPTL